jgi:hypothetical protein
MDETQALLNRNVPMVDKSKKGCESLSQEVTMVP